MDRRVNQLICRLDKTLHDSFPVVTPLGPSGPFPAVWALSPPRRQGARVAFCTDGGPNWERRTGSRAGAPITVFVYPGRRTGTLRDATCDWDLDVPADPEHWEPMLGELISLIREWEQALLQNAWPELPSQDEEGQGHGQEAADEGAEGQER